MYKICCNTTQKTQNQRVAKLSGVKYHAEIIPEQGASKMVKISQKMAKLCRKLKWLLFSGTRCWHIGL